MPAPIAAGETRRGAAASGPAVTEHGSAVTERIRFQPVWKQPMVQLEGIDELQPVRADPAVLRKLKHLPFLQAAADPVIEVLDAAFFAWKRAPFSHNLSLRFSRYSRSSSTTRPSRSCQLPMAVVHRH
jgi:hypothetical protein